MDLFDRCIDEILKRDPQVNAIVVRDFDRARDAARRADERASGGGDLPPLHGLPVTVKEAFDVEGLATTWGRKELSSNIAHHNAEAVQRLIDSGAIVLGKSNVPNNLADCQTYNELYGVTNNPWNLERTPGGSSGGSGAALAAGFVPLELGSDLAGSIRTPSHFCGVFGHKSSFGVVPSSGHSPAGPGAASDISVMGPMARSAEDLKLAMSVLAGPSAMDAAAWTVRLPEARHLRLKDFRVAIWLDQNDHEVDNEIANALLKLAVELRRAGASVAETITFPFALDEVHRDFVVLTRSVTIAGSPTNVLEGYRREAAGLAPDDYSYGAALRRAAALYHTDWLALNRRRYQRRMQLEDLFSRYDVILCPVHTTTAFRHDHSEPREARTIMVNGRQRDYSAYLFWLSLAGLHYLPATVMPVGLSRANLPIAIQVIGPYLGDLTSIQFAELARELCDPIVYPGEEPARRVS